jgi:hypothetical protein
MDYPDAYLMKNLAHNSNVAVNLEVEERRRVDVQASFLELALIVYIHMYMNSILLLIYF